MRWIYHQREARVIYSLTTDRQPVIYWATNHLLARLYFDSYTQETTKGQVFPSDVTPSNVMEMINDVRKQNQNDVMLVRAVICCRVIHSVFHCLYRHAVLE